MEQNADTQVTPVQAGGTPEDLLRSLYTAHGAALVAYIERMTHDRHQAEDVVQETLIRAWLHADRLRPDPAQSRAWLYRVARNIAIDGMRLRHAYPQELWTLASAVVTHVDEVDQTLTTIEITKALDTLNPDQRAVVVEVYYRGRTVAQAAQLLHIPRGTAKSRLFYALRLLRAALPDGQGR